MFSSHLLAVCIACTLSSLVSNFDMLFLKHICTWIEVCVLWVMCVCVLSVQLCVQVCMCGGPEEDLILFCRHTTIWVFSLFVFCFWRYGLLWAWNSSSRLGQLGSYPQRFLCLPLYQWDCRHSLPTIPDIFLMDFGNLTQVLLLGKQVLSTDLSVQLKEAGF